MNRFLLVTTSVFGLLAMQGLPARADEALDKMAKDPKQWVMQQGDDANTRFSKLNQITAANVKKLQVAWTFSTGVLRGHEGGPLVVGDVMYVHTPFPNTVYALDLNHEGKIIWKYEPRQDPNVIPIMCCDTVNRGVAYADGKIFLHQADTTLVALDAKTGAKVWSVMDGEAGKGQSGTDAPFVFKDKVLVGISGGEFGVRGWVSAYNIKDGKLAWRGYSEGPDADTLIDPDEDHRPRQAGRPGFIDLDLGGRPVEDRRRRHLGMVFLRSRTEPRLLRFGQSLDLESGAASGRQSLVDVDLGPRSRYRQGQMDLPDDAA